MTASIQAQGRSAISWRDTLRRATPALGTGPFFAYTLIFLLIPTAIVVIGAFQDNSGRFSLSNIAALGTGPVLDSFMQSLVLSAVTAVIGGVVGSVLAYAVATAGPDTATRRVVTSASSVLAQFGGVMLAFAFIATVGSNGIVTQALHTVAGVQTTGSWLYTVPGLILVYSYFQIPLMVIIFLPAVDGIRPEWREASESLGGSTWAYWRHVAGPILAVPFAGSLLLLFANAFAAYATAAALITQSNPLVPLQISGAITNEVNVTGGGVAKALALGMVVVVAIVMGAYAILQRRAARWLK